MIVKMLFIVRDGLKKEKSAHESVVQEYYAGSLFFTPLKIHKNFSNYSTNKLHNHIETIPQEAELLLLLLLLL